MSSRFGRSCARARHAAAEAALTKFRAVLGDASAYRYATIYAQWGDIPKAIVWLNTAMHVRDPGLVLLKTDPLMGPLRTEQRLQAVMRELRFPDCVIAARPDVSIAPERPLGGRWRSRARGPVPAVLGHQTNAIW